MYIFVNVRLFSTYKHIIIMATVKFLLHRPYKKTSSPDKMQDQSSVNDIISKGKKTKKKRILVDKEVRIYAVLIIRMNEVVKIKTDSVINPKDWDFKGQKMKETLPDAFDFNNDLTKLKKKILSEYNKTVKDHPDMSFPGIYRIMYDFGKKQEIPFLQQENDFFGYLDEYIEFLKGEVTYRTAQKYTTLKNSLKDFGKKNTKYQDLSFSMIDHRFKDAYVKYLRSQKPRGRQKTRPDDFQDGLLIDTESKYIASFKSFCRWSEERGYNKYSVYKQFSKVSAANKKRSKPVQEIVTLTLQELSKFYNHDFSDRPTLDHCRDLFCFAAYTGQRWSDIERFDRKDLIGDVWSFTAAKTLKETKIDLIGYAAPAIDILMKYNYQLPKISLVKFNLYIKDAAQIAGITEETSISRYVGSNKIPITKPKYKFISSHSARKTCVSLLLNEFNIPISHVLEITGHSDLKTLQKYVNKDRSSRREFMSKTTAVNEIKLTVAS